MTLKQTATAGGGRSNDTRNSSGDRGEKTDGAFTNASETPTVLALIPCRNKICTRVGEKHTDVTWKTFNTREEKPRCKLKLAAAQVSLLNPGLEWDASFFDEPTGTLTEGKPAVTDVVSVVRKESEVLQLAAAVEKAASHPIAKAILSKAESLNLEIPSTSGQLTEPEAVESIAKVIGVENVNACLNPQEKARFISNLQNQGNCVAMVCTCFCPQILFPVHLEQFRAFNQRIVLNLLFVINQYHHKS
ncbi:Copper-exporting P-type ATPase B [Nymphaea thermarum]|nr:Copper-exporting P-type ATPase B [Nymphaea thermarum]